MITRVRADLALTWSFLRHRGAARAAMIAACTALVSGLIIVIVAVLLHPPAASGGEAYRFSALVDEPGLRPGFLFAVGLLCVAPLTLLRQVIRLGTASREQRLAALRLAGATPGDVRRLGALEVGAPAFVGGLAGYAVYRVLGFVLGERSAAGDTSVLALVPTGVGLTWWHVLLVAAGVGALGVLTGAAAGRGVLISPLGVSRRAPRRAPRPWGLVLIAFAILPLGSSIASSQDDLLLLAAIATLVLGLLSLAPFVAHVAGRLVASRASSALLLVAGRRLATDARPAGRAAAAVGAIGLVAGVGSNILAGLPRGGRGGSLSDVEPFYTLPFALGAVALLAALALVVFSLAVHQVESLVDHRRSLASLAALGLTPRDLERASRWEVGLAAVPMAAFGVLVGALPGGQLLLAPSNGYGWIPVAVSVVTIALVVLAVLVSTRITRPWLVRAASPDNLRTP